ncbi:hypothetical protein RFI_25028 [Reticulomyxa filosa]|uniref:Uncharacterized protein n=1 Tax=Reticulomyxa filosa TaxID=46433 RepID=X6MEB6_RETFI|nr:hypothetical protein RFI_25028 [Reticulomyxa filosa]|eukprot:ETO12348.1 hypothetical protein RFI_25028 [Reticulomyxa filosa]
MKASLVLVVLHVLNALVVLNANKTNTSSCSWTSGQTHFNQHGNMNILLISRDMFLKHSANYIWKLEMWKYDQSLQIYNNVASASSLQISDIESMHSENEIIRVLQSNFVTSSNESKSNFNTKLLIINTCTFTNKFPFKQATFRLLKNCKVVLMISTPSFNRSCNIENRVWIGNVVCDQLFWDNKQEDSPTSHPNHIVQLRQLFCPMLQSAIAGTHFDGKFVTSFPWHRHAFGVIEALLAQMGKVGDDAADEQVGRAVHNALNSPPHCCQLNLSTISWTVTSYFCFFSLLLFNNKYYFFACYLLIENTYGAMQWQAMLMKVLLNWITSTTNEYYIHFVACSAIGALRLHGIR